MRRSINATCNEDSLLIYVYLLSGLWNQSFDQRLIRLWKQYRSGFESSNVFDLSIQTSQKSFQDFPLFQ